MTRAGVSAAAQIKFLVDNPHFDEMPATVDEFLGDHYLECAHLIRPGVRDALIDIFGDKVNPQRMAVVEESIFTGGIGIGKSTMASIALPYCVHWTLCLKDPQAFYNLLPGTRIAAMMMSTSEKQAKDVIFSDVKARINNSPWFKNNYPYDPKTKNVIKFEKKNVWIIPGGSVETSFEGYNVLVGVIDEIDSHKKTALKDYADVGYDSIRNRIASRYIDTETNGHRGLLMCIGQMKSAQGFAARKLKAFEQSNTACTAKLAIWESLGWHKFSKSNGQRDSFWYDRKRNKFVPGEIAQYVQSREFLIEVPNAYRKDFENNPIKALRDLAGIPPSTDDPFITMLDRVDEAVEKWVERAGFESPVLPDPGWPKLLDGFQAPDSRRRAIALDLATSGDGDALGIAMGFVDGLIEEDGELKPYIVFDLLARIKAIPGQEIILSEVRKFVYHLRDELGFKIVDLTIDGFQSTDSLQIFRKKKFRAEYLSVDRSTGPYEDLREAIYDRRIEFPKYTTYKNRNDNDLVQIAYQELSELSYDGKKVDHPPKGSKDVTDCMAAVVSKLMGDKSYRRGAKRPEDYASPDYGQATEVQSDTHTPISFNVNQKSSSVDLGTIPGMNSLIPPHLRAKRRPGFSQ